MISFGVIMGLYEYLIRRTSVLRFLCRMKVPPQKKEVPAVEAQGAAAES